LNPYDNLVHYHLTPFPLLLCLPEYPPRLAFTPNDPAEIFIQFSTLTAFHFVLC